MEFEYELIYRDSAESDLLEYADYIERKTFSKEKATILTTVIVAEITKLMVFPYIYVKFYKDFYSFSIKNRRIFYKVYEAEKKIVVFKVLGWFQNYQDYL